MSSRLNDFVHLGQVKIISQPSASTPLFLQEAAGLARLARFPLNIRQLGDVSPNATHYIAKLRFGSVPAALPILFQPCLAQRS